MNDKPMTLYDHLLFWALKKRARHHGVNVDKPQLTQLQAVRMMGDNDGVHFSEGIDQIPPEILPQIVEALGFVPHRESHDVDCPTWQTDKPCDCIQPVTTWTAPEKVQKAMGEDPPTRIAARRGGG